MTDTPFTIIFDCREQLPYRFRNIRATAKGGGHMLQVATQSAYLATGDYSIVGLTDRVAVERKSLPDLYATVGRGRDRFRNEVERLSSMDLAAVVVEASLSDIATRPPEHSRMSPRAVVNTIVAWQQKYPRVSWWFADTRRFAEILTYRILEKFYAQLAASAKTV